MFFPEGRVGLYAVVMVFSPPQNPGQNPGQKYGQKPVQKSGQNTAKKQNRVQTPMNKIRRKQK